MPVADHPVHPHGIRVGDYKAGCYNRGPMKAGYYATDRHYDASGKWKLIMVWIPHKMTTECQQDGALSECRGCKHGR